MEVVTSRWSWLDITSGGPDEDGMFWLTAMPKPRYWLYPSFWLMALRSRSLMPTAADIEVEETIELGDTNG
jgi:hypothetical protein